MATGPSHWHPLLFQAIKTPRPLWLPRSALLGSTLPFALVHRGTSTNLGNASFLHQLVWPDCPKLNGTCLPSKSSWTLQVQRHVEGADRLLQKSGLAAQTWIAEGSGAGERLHQRITCWSLAEMARAVTCWQWVRHHLAVFVTGGNSLCNCSTHLS